MFSSVKTKSLSEVCVNPQSDLGKMLIRIWERYVSLLVMYSETTASVLHSPNPDDK